MRLRTLFAILALCAAVRSALSSSKPPLWENLDQFSPALTSELPMTDLSITPWEPGVISQGCMNVTIKDEQDPRTFSAYSVKYDDCGQSWNFCIQNGSNQSIEDLAITFGQTPVRLRQYTSDVVMSTDGFGALVGNQTLMLYMPATVQMLLHEMTHNADMALAYKTPGISLCSFWSDAYDQDPAVPDNYAQTNQPENFAQFTGLVVYSRMTNGQLLTDQPDLWKIQNQFKTMADEGDNGQHGGRMFDYDKGLNCSFRSANSPPVRVTSVGETHGDVFAAEAHSDFVASFDLAAQVEHGKAHGINVSTETPNTNIQCSGGRGKRKV
ncbi:hypothetical protein BJ166DRAFT_596477 [Pestalotiopsis sp. NC0098]|nr:hypothetical protein BJ166DRAFT_596477 [Pestalotiopsis sp. NC0098]